MIVTLVRVFLLLLAVIGLAVACRSMFRQSRLIGVLVLAGVVLRAAGGVSLFVISDWNLAVMRGAQLGDGFWALAPDSRVYYELASGAAGRGPEAIPPGSPSPFYVGVLALWLAATGISVLNAVLFNAVCYVLACLAIMSTWKRTGTGPPRMLELEHAPVLLSVFCLTFSPILVLTSTQVLKDPFFALLIVIACVGGFKILDALRNWPATWQAVVRWTALVTVAQVGIAGIRAYYSAFVLIAIGCGLAAVLWSTPWSRMRRLIAPSVSIVMVVWLAFIAGAGPYYSYYGDLVRGATGISIPGLTTPMPRLARWIGWGASSGTVGSGIGMVGESIIGLRRGFVHAGGATNLADDNDEENAGSMAEKVGIGILAMLVPISILQSTSIVSVTGGRGLLVVTDIDTVFIDLTLLGAGVLLYRSRGTVGRRVPKVVFAATMAFICTLLLAFIVTNLGTLYRLRLIAVAPAWLVPVAIAVREQET